MATSKDILQQKAQQTGSLKDSINHQNKSAENETDKPTFVINEDGKKILVFKDPLYTREHRSIVNYTILKGKWQFENIDDIDEDDTGKCAVKFTMSNNEEGEFTLIFNSLKDRVEFMDSIYSQRELIQIGSGMSFEKIVNSKVAKTTGSLLGLSIAGYGLYKLFGKKN